MKTLVAVPVAVALFGGMLMLAGGCVPQSKYDDLAAANRNAQAELSGALDALNKLKAENNQLRGDLQKSAYALDAANKENDLLKNALAKLQGEYDDLSKKYAARGPGEAPPQDFALPSDVNAALRDLAKEMGWEWDPVHNVARLPSDMTFEKGSDFVKPEAKVALAKFAKIMEKPSVAGLYVYVAGHTDDIPIVKSKDRHPDNWYLSVHRAVAVEKELVKGQMAPKRIGAMGYSEYYPIAPNAAGNKGNSQNRRVELWIVPAEKFLVLPMGEKTPIKKPGKTDKTAEPAKPAKPAPDAETGTEGGTDTGTDEK